MQIYDISQEVMGSVVYPGDPSPEKKQVLSIADGSVCNLTAFSMCAHNGTHVDAPYHFINDGETIEDVPLYKFIGEAYVAECDGEIDALTAQDILERARAVSEDAARRILIKGGAHVSADAARVLAEAGVYLVASENQSVGPTDAPMEVHLILLGARVVLLEGVRLADVPDGAYLLNCAPISIAGSDGAPCRAVLIKM